MATTWGQRITKFREQAGLSQTQVSQRTGITRATLHRWEHNDGQTIHLGSRLSTVLDLSRLYGCTVEEFVCGRRK